MSLYIQVLSKLIFNTLSQLVKAQSHNADGPISMATLLQICLWKLIQAVQQHQKFSNRHTIVRLTLMTNHTYQVSYYSNQIKDLTSYKSTKKQILHYILT